MKTTGIFFVFIAAIKDVTAGLRSKVVDLTEDERHLFNRSLENRTLFELEAYNRSLSNRTLFYDSFFGANRTLTNRSLQEDETPRRMLRSVTDEYENEGANRSLLTGMYNRSLYDELYANRSLFGFHYNRTLENRTLSGQVELASAHRNLKSESEDYESIGTFNRSLESANRSLFYEYNRSLFDDHWANRSLFNRSM